MQIEQRILTSGSWWNGYYDRVAIVNHIMQGGIVGSEARFNNRAEEVSAHYGVDDNRVVQWVSDNNSSWANGVFPEEGYNSTIPFLVECDKKGVSPNKRTISIENAGNSGDTFSEAHYLNLLNLHVAIIKKWPNIKVSRKNIIFHSDISPKSKPFCPGEGFPIERLLDDLATILPVGGVTMKVPGNFTVNPSFTDFWFEHGGLPIFGYPITRELSVKGPLYGSAISVQYFERARFELQPSGSVMLGLVGSEARSIDLRFPK